MRLALYVFLSTVSFGRNLLITALNVLCCKNVFVHVCIYNLAQLGTCMCPCGAVESDVNVLTVIEKIQGSDR